MLNGQCTPAGSYLEPNNLMPPEYCAGANSSQTAGEDATDVRPDGAGLWEDRNCAERHPFICEVPLDPKYDPFTTSSGQTFR